MFLIIIFIVTLNYLALAGRMDTYIRLLFFQGILLFGIAFHELHEIEPVNLVFILLETLVFKAFVVPFMLTRIVKRNKLRHEIEPNVSNFASLFIVASIIAASFILAYSLHDEHLKIIYFAASISALFTGLFLIISRRKLLTHIMGYLVIENGIFLLSLALGSEMPVIVNIGILMDLFTSVLILSTFVNKIGDAFKTIHIESLSELRD
jgi:hydrogenase-4 component E